MISDSDFVDIAPPISVCEYTSDHVQSGLPIAKVARVKGFSPDEWEVFVQEWASSLVGKYLRVSRFGGAGDQGVDVAGFYSDSGFRGAWDNYQCKHYKNPLSPNNIWVEIGKTVYYSFLGEYTPPTNYYFVCPQDIGTKLEQYLNKVDVLKVELEKNWDGHCQKSITTIQDITLTGDLKAYFDQFDFSIFKSKSVVDLITGHQNTTFHAVRFGGGLPPRPSLTPPPQVNQPEESLYIRKILDAYEEHSGKRFEDSSFLESHEKYKRDYDRQRLRFYHAEALRNFARDTVPEGTFESLQDELFNGVIDTCEDDHDNGLKRMRAVMQQVTQTGLTSNPLVVAVKVEDRQGICHQLANEDRLTWVNEDDD